VPVEVNHAAPAVAERQVFIRAPRERVWNFLSRIDDWPQWQTGVSSARLDGPLRRGSACRWRAGGLTVKSTLTQVTPPFHMGCTGKGALGLRVRNAWHLYRHPDGTVAMTAESFEGPLARLLRPLLRRTLKRELENRVSGLKREAEIGGAIRTY
jgi:Polyketide cyclase / dehydrase and lipid transport